MLPLVTRRRLNVNSTDFFPAYVVWELTLRCDHACLHCGSRASAARPDELSTEEALVVANEIADLGARDVILIGGEAYLHEGFLDIARALKNRGVRPGLTTGGRGVTLELARAMAEAGVHQVSVSVDGLEATHDRMRNLKGSYAGAMRALDNVRAAGMRPMANTNVNRLNMADLEGLYEVLEPLIIAWQVQITTPLGRAADRTLMVLQPWDLLDVMPRIAALKQRALAHGISLMPGNNLGYFGPEEALLRSQRPAHQKDHFSGCQAGRYVMGIESDGAVKGCPSLQTSHYVGGRTRERSVTQIWKEAPELAFARSRTREDLWGYCKTCAFGDTCLGGCSFTAHAVLGRPGNNPYCHYRARDLHKQGLRERLVSVEAAPGRPFDNGRFEIQLEPADAPDPELHAAPERLVQLDRRPRSARPA